MKIKSLKIRNIASIEKGDIDFENGLIDPETGMPSSLFLITGDTGSGKSVILDCISMALYGTTPRVKSVSDSKNNSYVNTDGEEISVNNIRQYTRIGISWRDECYTELSFTGNDEVEYISRFSLGRTNRRNYRNPEWKLTIGDQEAIDNRKDEIKERIRKAVGLSFEQFSRMAMLAQGQFATFLTGKKEERERILEQLTATDIFSRYGDAITNIYKRTKQEKETAVKVYEEFNKKILSEETRQTLQTEHEEKTRVAAAIRTETETLRQRILHTEAAVKAEKEIEILKAEETLLKATEDTPEFRKQTALLSLWDETEQQRKLLSEKLDSMRSLDSDMRTLKNLKTDFLNLSNDLSDRMEAAEARTIVIEKEREWLDAREPLRKTFSESSATILQISNYLQHIKEAELKEKEVKEGKEQIESLLREIEQQEKLVKDRAQACSACQTAINSKSAERDEINPSGLRKENERLTNRKHSMHELAALIAKSESEKEEAIKAEEEATLTRNLMKEQEEAEKKAKSDCATAEKEMKEADDRYKTMHLSIEKNFKELRVRLTKEHATVCPLCGQSITEHLNEWSDDGYFSGILSPLDEEKKRLTETFTNTKKESDEASKKLNTTSGILKAKESELNKLLKNLAKTESEIKQRLNTLEITASSDLSINIQIEIAKIESDIKEISVKLNTADSIQKEIDGLLSNKESLDKEHSKADGLLQKNVRELTKKKETLRNAEARTEELLIETQNLRDTITNALKGYSDDWMDNPAQTSAILRKDADEYTEKSSWFAKNQQEHDALIKSLDSLNTLRESLSEQLAAFDGTADSMLNLSLKSLKIGVIQKKWNDFAIEVSTALRRKTENEDRIKQLDEELKEYYEASGKTETTLKQLLNASNEVNQARSMHQRHRDSVNKNSTLLESAVNSRSENLKALEIEDTVHLEDIEALKATLSEKEKLQSELTQCLGVIMGKLDADENMRKDSENQRNELEQKSLRHEKWEKMNRYFGGTRFRTLVQSHILRPLLDNANIYLRQITDHYTLTCSDENEQLSILVLDRYHNNEPRSVTVLSGGERFMISLALSLALSAMNRPDLNVDILFIDEGFGTLDAKSLEMVMSTLRRLPEINGQNGRRVGVISHREELTEQIPTQIQLKRLGQGRSHIIISNS